MTYQLRPITLEEWPAFMRSADTAFGGASTEQEIERYQTGENVRSEPARAAAPSRTQYGEHHATRTEDAQVRQRRHPAKMSIDPRGAERP